MVVGFEVTMPWYALFNERLWEKRDKLCRGFSVAGRKQRHLVSPRDLFLNKVVYNDLRSSVVLGRYG